METQTINKTNLLPSDYWNQKLTDDEYFQRLELGYVFKPTDAQIIVALLMRKIKNEKLHRNQVKLGNIYEIDPETLADDYGKLSTEIWYLFTIRDRKYQNENINVSTVDGYWQVKGDGESMEENGKTVGFLKTFQFYRGKPGSGSKTSWLMHEFRVIDPLPKVEGQTKLDNWVLCKIWNKERGWYYENKEMFTSTRRKRDLSSPKKSYNLRKKKHIYNFHNLYVLVLLV